MKPVTVVAYDSRWPLWFEELRAALWPAVAGLALTIEHVGSTAVPHLAAKPVIDIDIVIPVADVLPAVTARLSALGYVPRGDLGIAGREAFRAPAHSPIAHHLYVCVEGSLPLRNHLILRDHLRANPADAVTYSEWKLDLARRHPTDMAGYIAGKTPFVLEILRRYGVTESDLAAIEAANRPSGGAIQ